MALRFNFFSSKTFLFVLLIALVWLGISVVRVTYNRYQFNTEIERLKGEIERTEKRNEELASLIEFFKTESFLEKEAKEKLNLKKEGENVVVVPDTPSISPDLLFPESAKDNSFGSQPKELSNSEKWWLYLFKE